MAALTRPGLLDNAVLSNLALVRRTDLVELWTATACTTPQVLHEYRAGVTARSLPADAWAGLTVVTLSPDEVAFAAGLPPKLRAGERTCLAVSIRRQGLFASDDLDARVFARQAGVPTTGTLGILAIAVSRGDLSLEEADTLLARMIAANYRSPVTSLRALLEPRD